MESGDGPKIIHGFRKGFGNLSLGRPKFPPSMTSPKPNELGVHTGAFIVSPRVGDRLIRPLIEPKNRRGQR